MKSAYRINILYYILFTIYFVATSYNKHVFVTHRTDISIHYVSMNNVHMYFHFCIFIYWKSVNNVVLCDTLLICPLFVVLFVYMSGYFKTN